MNAGRMSRFGERLRQRIKAAGFGNISELLRRIRVNHGFVTGLRRGDQDDAGIAKLAKIAIILGVRPSELIADFDEELLNPDPLSADVVRSLGFPRPPEAYDLFRLALVLDVVLAWDEEVNATTDQPRLIALADDLYDEFVRADRGVTPLKLRQRVMARVFGVDLPDMPSPPRGRGRPATSPPA